MSIRANLCWIFLDSNLLPTDHEADEPTTTPTGKIPRPGEFVCQFNMIALTCCGKKINTNRIEEVADPLGTDECDHDGHAKHDVTGTFYDDDS